MNHIGIQQPCSENWNDMTPNERGVFCSKCVKQVHDFTNSSNEEIKQTLRSLIGQPVCGRLTPSQEASLNAEFASWNALRSKRTFQSAFVFSLVVVFGLTLFSCENEQDKQQIEHVRGTALKAMAFGFEKMETIEQVSQPEKTETFTAPIAIEEYNLEELAVEAYVEFPPVDIQEFCVKARMEDIHEIGTVGELVIRRDYNTFLQDSKPVETDENGVPYPEAFSAMVFPNPATIQTTLEIAVPEKERFEIVLYDSNGKILQQLWKGKIERGHFQLPVELSALNPGIYTIAIASGKFSETISISKL